MTIHLAKLHLATNGKQSSYGVNEVKSLFCLVRSVQMKKKSRVTETDGIRSQWPANEPSLRGKKTLNFHIPHFIFLPWWRSVCLQSVSYVCFQLQENQSMHVHGAIFKRRDFLIVCHVRLHQPKLY